MMASVLRTWIVRGTAQEAQWWMNAASVMALELQKVPVTAMGMWNSDVDAARLDRAVAITNAVRPSHLTNAANAVVAALQRGPAIVPATWSLAVVAARLGPAVAITPVALP